MGVGNSPTGLMEPVGRCEEMISASFLVGDYSPVVILAIWFENRVERWLWLYFKRKQDQDGKKKRKK